MLSFWLSCTPTRFAAKLLAGLAMKGRRADAVFTSFHGGTVYSTTVPREGSGDRCMRGYQRSAGRTLMVRLPSHSPEENGVT